VLQILQSGIHEKMKNISERKTNGKNTTKLTSTTNVHQQPPTTTSNQNHLEVKKKSPYSPPNQKA